MRVRMYRSERVWRRRAEDCGQQLTTAHGEVARLTRELARAERHARDAENRPAPVIPVELILTWSDGSRDTVSVHNYVRPR